MTCPRKLATLCIAMTMAAGLTGCIASSLDPDPDPDPDPGSADDPQPSEQRIDEQLSSSATPSSVTDCQYGLVQGPPHHNGPFGPVHNPAPGPNDTEPCSGPVY